MRFHLMHCYRMHGPGMVQPLLPSQAPAPAPAAPEPASASAPAPAAASAAAAAVLAAAALPEIPERMYINGANFDPESGGPPPQRLVVVANRLPVSAFKVGLALQGL
jgi:hypothetical protein